MNTKKHVLNEKKKTTLNSFTTHLFLHQYRRAVTKHSYAGHMTSIRINPHLQW